VDEKVGEFSRGVGKKNSQMAKTPLEYSCHSCSRVANNEMSDFIMKSGFFPEIVKG